jgi:hypothetical protein
MQVACDVEQTLAFASATFLAALVTTSPHNP